MSAHRSSVEPEQFRAYALAKLEQAAAALRGNEADLDVMAPAQLALMAVHMWFGATETITLEPADVVEYVTDPGPQCICPPDLLGGSGETSSETRSRSEE